MNEASLDLADFMGTARLFPLPNVVLFPQVMQPLHVFEPRYRQLAADALAGDRYIAMALLKPGWQNDYAGNRKSTPSPAWAGSSPISSCPTAATICCLRGMSRVQIVQEIPHTKLYRKARVDLLVDIEVEKTKTAKSLRRKLSLQAPRWFGEQKAVLAQMRKLFHSELPLGALCDIFAFALSLDVEFKQELLDELDVGKRVERLLSHLDAAKPCAVADVASSERSSPRIQRKLDYPGPMGEVLRTLGVMTA